MANDEEEEREFLERLKARTGRDLAAWMAAIAAQGFSDKNEIIDWLRGQGLPFARASWLERIHRNGGKPIHAGPPVGSDPAGLTPGHTGPTAARSTAAPPSTPRQTALSPSGMVPPPAQAAPASDAGGRAMGSDPQGLTPIAAEAAPKPAAKPQKAPPTVESAADAAALEKLVAAAKGYRPLYQFLEGRIRQAIPGVAVAARGRYVSIAAPREFAAVTLHPTEVRLGLDLGDRPVDALAQTANLRGPGPAISHMVVLTDARQVNDDLMSLLKTANARVNAAE